MNTVNVRAFPDRGGKWQISIEELGRRDRGALRRGLTITNAGGQRSETIPEFRESGQG